MNISTTLLSEQSRYLLARIRGVHTPRGARTISPEEALRAEAAQIAKLQGLGFAGFHRAETAMRRESLEALARELGISLSTVEATKSGAALKYAASGGQSVAPNRGPLRHITLKQ